MRTLSKLISFSALSVALTAPATASVIKVDVYGMFASGVDRAGLFIQKDGDLTGYAFKIVETIDLSKLTTIPDPFIYSATFGAKATLTVDGKSITIDAPLNITTETPGKFSSNIHKPSLGGILAPANQLILNVESPDIPGGPSSFTVSGPTATISGSFYKGPYNAYSEGTFTAGLVAVGVVPLPASAPLFGASLLGLAGLGYAARRKKAAA